MSKKLKDIVNYISEGSKLDQYISSKGIDPTRLSRASKIGHSRSLEFQTWQKGHLMDSVNTPSKDDDDDDYKIDTTAGEMGTPEFAKALKSLKWMAHIYKPKKPEKKKEDISEDKFQDPKAATQTVGMENENCGISKSAKLVKSIYKQKRGMQEDTYAHDAEKYTPSGKNKEPKQPPEDKTVYPDDSPKARSILSGGKTMTGKPRDDIEIDPEMVKPDLGQK